MKNVLLLFGALLLVICMPLFWDGLHDARVDRFEEAYTSVTTGAGVTTVNITLSQDLWNDSATSVKQVSSNTTGDIPTAIGYNAVSHTLTLSGLVESSTRSLLVNYEIASTSISELQSIDAFMVVIAVFIVLGVLGIIAAAVYGFFR